jgi:hypothetical protein
MKNLINEAFRLQQIAGIHSITTIHEKMDPVGHEDADIDNDGDVDKSDKYLANRRKAIAANIKEDNEMEFPKEISSRYGNQFVFIHDDNKPGFYDIKDLETGKMIGRVGFPTPEKARSFAMDLVKAKGGTISTQLEGQDHEVAMAHASLKAIISSASQLMDKIGEEEINIPAWIQDHITNSENYIEQANQGYHHLCNYGGGEEAEVQVAVMEKDEE